VPELELEFYGPFEADMDREFSPGSWQGSNQPMKLRDIVAAVKKTYCGTIGVEYMYISDTKEKRWIQKRFEGTQSTPSLTVRRSAGSWSASPPRDAGALPASRAMSARSASRARAARA
jgi:2-oxoglutarate dehydrogenase E1 component